MILASITLLVIFEISPIQVLTIHQQLSDEPIFFLLQLVEPTLLIFFSLQLQQLLSLIQA